MAESNLMDTHGRAGLCITPNYVFRRNKRLKHGKEHRYWSVVEIRCVAAVPQTLLYLGEINDCENAAWSYGIEAIDDQNESCQLHFASEDRTTEPLLTPPSLQLQVFWQANEKDPEIPRLLA